MKMQKLETHHKLAVLTCIPALVHVLQQLCYSGTNIYPHQYSVNRAVTHFLLLITYITLSNISQDLLSIETSCYTIVSHAYVIMSTGSKK